ncbi:XrtA system polysaccharide chain length determinant [Blastomonas marina]|uniref:XrtA system polysaccharide chain length determinant n=1 Tax=Blastomonas marina TaxID=1867408 RepID=UPI002AC8FC9B|nr:XrtA system polysaccharide chain length determinant [Blastomonas marina]WPZ04983.1 XrtA system polysaccharide chain length determinant [Blastomonas marina]
MSSIYDELRAAAFTVWRRKWLALAVAWGTCTLGWILVALVPNSYESRSRILVQLEDPLAQQVGIGVQDRRREIDRVRQTLTGALNLEKVVRSTRLGDDVNSAREMESAVLALSNNIEVSSEQDNLFVITGKSGDSSLSDSENALLAQDIVQKMIDIFREENLAGGRGELTETLAFMDQQLEERSKELEAAEQRRLAFESSNPEFALGGGALVQRLEAARSQLRAVEADLAAAQSALSAINAQLASTPRRIVGGGADNSIAGSVARAKADLAAMRARGLTDNHPDVIAQKNQIASMEAQARAAGGGGAQGQLNPAYSTLESLRADRQASVLALQTRKAGLQAEVADLSSKQFSNPQLAAEAQRIGRDYDVLKDQYDKLLRDREELRLRGQVETERSAVKFQVIDPPTTPVSPAAPNRPLLLIGVLIAGIGAGIAAAFVIGQLRSTFATTAQLEKSLGLPVLGAITHTWTQSGRALRAKRLKLFYAGSGALAGVCVLLLAAEFIQRGMVA